MKDARTAKLAGGTLVAVLALTPLACLLAHFLLPGGGAALERLVVALAELLFLCAAFRSPGLSLPQMGDWHPVAIWLILGWFLMAICTTFNSDIATISLVRQAEWLLHGIFAALASVYLTAHPSFRRSAIAATAFGLLMALGILAASWSAPWGEWGRAWQIIVTEPLVGTGPDQYAYLRPGHDHPGNMLLQLALDWGVPGLIIFLIAMACVVGRGLRGKGAGRLIGPGIVLGLMAAGLISGTLYHASTLLFLSIGTAFCLKLEPFSEDRGFDKDIHGLAILSAIVLLMQAVLVKTLLLGPVPPITSMAAHVTRHVPMAMGWQGAGEQMNRWATQWRRTDKKEAYDLLDWSAKHSRQPESNLRLEAAWFHEDGFESEAQYTLKLAEAAAGHP